MRDDEIESDDKSPLVSGSNPVAAAFALICKMEKDKLSMEKVKLSPTTPASEMITLALIGAWHNSLARMPAVILVSPLLDYYYWREI